MSVALLNRSKLEKVARMKFDKSDFEQLHMLTTIYAERFQKPQLPDFMLADTPLVSERAINLFQRRNFVEAVWDTWNDCRHLRLRRKRDAKRLKSKLKQRQNATDDDCIDLLLELFAAVGETYSAATLRHDLHFIKTGRRHG